MQLENESFCLTPWEASPYDLISWWSMEEFSASEFYELSTLLESVARTTVMVVKLAKTKGSSLSGLDNIRLTELNSQEPVPMVSRLTSMERACNKIGLRDSAEVIVETKAFLTSSGGNIPISEIGPRIAEIQRAIQREMKRHLFLHIPVERAEYYHSWGMTKRKARDEEIPLFGDIVNNKFPSTVYDIAEAGNSFAAGRFTACVFHLMRVVERAVQDTATKLGLPITAVCDKEWQLIINGIRGQLNALYPKHKDSEREKFEAILGHLETIKIAWRNPTMHPKITYTEEEAKTLLKAVEVFMKELTKVI